MNAYHTVFSTVDPQNNRNQFENQVEPKSTTESTNILRDGSSAVEENATDQELIFRFLGIVAHEAVNQDKTSLEKLEIAKQMAKALHS